MWCSYAPAPRKLSGRPSRSRALLHQAADFHLGQRFGNAGERLDAQRRGDLVEQRIDARRADGGQHLANVGFGVRDERHVSAPPSSTTFS